MRVDWMAGSLLVLLLWLLLWLNLLPFTQCFNSIPSSSLGPLGTWIWDSPSQTCDGMFEVHQKTEVSTLEILLDRLPRNWFAKIMSLCLLSLSGCYKTEFALLVQLMPETRGFFCRWKCFGPRLVWWQAHLAQLSLSMWQKPWVDRQVQLLW